MSAVRKLTADVITYKKICNVFVYLTEEKKKKNLLCRRHLLYIYISVFIRYRYVHLLLSSFFPMCLETENKNSLIDSSMVIYLMVVYNSLLVLAHTVSHRGSNRYVPFTFTMFKKKKNFV